MAKRQKPKTLKQVKSEIIDEEYEAVDDKRGLGWLLFRAPGQLFLWLQYLNPSNGRVLVSARQKGHVVMEVWYSLVFWAVLAFAFYFLFIKERALG
ncbi:MULTISPECIES: hypothetical protein [Rhizobium]|uniref:hypothetical protein n=1 Tax=Rhizobium TaxID=379 RepID=UPI00140D3A8E|nr:MULTISPECIES: hypothetical protein [Rhizobium]MDG3576335.1 hypothetical protein [Rhizobium sp. YJ-22]